MVWETRPRDSEVRRGEAESELRSDWQAEARPTKAVRAALGWTGRRPIPQCSDEESMSCEEVFRRGRAESCHDGVVAIASPKINQTIETLNRMLHDPKWPRMVRSLELFTDETGVQLNLIETDRLVAKRFFEWCAGNIQIGR